MGHQWRNPRAAHRELAILARVAQSCQQDHRRCKMQKRQVVAGGFLVASGDPAALFQRPEQAFDRVALRVQMLVVLTLYVAVLLLRDHRLGSRLLDDFVAVVVRESPGPR